MYRLLIVLISAGLYAQDIRYNWANKQYSCPAEVSSPRDTQVIVTNVNDVLYAYTVEITETRRVIDDFASLVGTLPKDALPKAVVADKCKDGLATAQTAAENLDAALNPKPDKDGKYTSIPLAKTQEAWKDFAVLGKSLEAIKGCKFGTADQSRYQTLLKAYDELKKIDTHVRGKHEARDPIGLVPETDYKIVITERYNGQVTIGGEQQFECKPPSNQLTLSAGFLMSTIPGRTYSIRDVPKLDGNTTQDSVYRGVAVGGSTNLRPAAAALLNYRLPIVPRKIENWFSLSASSGPVYKLGGTAQTSNLGFFGGVSVGLWRRLFVAPGWHVGEFAEFPLGYSGGSFVPTSVNELTPTKRWTARFAVGITYRTSAFSSGSGDKPEAGNSKPTQTGAQGAPAPEPAKPPPTPSN